MAATATAAATAADQAPTKLDTMAYAWQQAKEREENARSARLEIERAMLAEVAGLKEEGTTTETGNYYRVKIKTKIARDLDESAIQSLPQDLAGQVIAYKPTINLTAYRQLYAAHKGELAAIVTTKPAKPSFKIEEM